MSAPKELSVVEIRKYMLQNGCRVTNHALVKHFKRFLTHPQTQIEARKQFKTYVNILATIKNENNQKFLILRKKYINECPAEEEVERAMATAASDAVPSSPGGSSIISEGSLSSPAPFRQPPPYKPPPEVSSSSIASGNVQQENLENYRECVNEFEEAMRRIDPARLAHQTSTEHEEKQKSELQEKTDKEEEETIVELRGKSVSRSNSADEKVANKENIPRFSFSSGNSATSVESTTAEKVSSSEGDAENPISVKEATRKFNRMASEEEAKLISPPSKKKSEKQLIEEKNEPEVTLAHPKAKEWLVSMARANYQELAKLAIEFPELVKLQDPCTGYTALHWAAKHGNEDVVKLIAGTYKADVNARTNGGYTPLHLAMQFGRVNIFELLCNVYKANRDLMDWSGNKPLDYSQQRTSVSALTYSSEYLDLILPDDNTAELNNNHNNFAGLNYLLGGGGGGFGGTIGSALSRGKKRPNIRYSTISSPLMRTQSMMTSANSPRRQPYVPPKSMFVSKEVEEEGLVPCSVASSLYPADNNNINNNTLKITSPKCSPKVSPKSSPRGSTSGNDEPGVSYRDKDQFGTRSTARRKKSFLHKSLAAAKLPSSNKKKPEVVTNQMLTE